jgi:hypothetical protein
MGVADVWQLTTWLTRKVDTDLGGDMLSVNLENWFRDTE